jgi:hypothetical protein
VNRQQGDLISLLIIITADIQTERKTGGRGDRDRKLIGKPNFIFPK